MTILLRAEHQKFINFDCENSYPNEGCGFLLGIDKGHKKEVVLVVNAINRVASSTKRSQYLIPPKDFLKIEKFARNIGLSIIGFYHSHPDSDCHPSNFDRQHAWPWFAYIIVSVKESRSLKMASWVLADNRTAFVRERLIVFS